MVQFIFFLMFLVYHGMNLVNTFTLQSNQLNACKLCSYGSLPDTLYKWLKQIQWTGLKQRLHGPGPISISISINRVGRYSRDSGKPRTIVAKFASFKEREAIFSKAKHARNSSSIIIYQDFSTRVTKKRQELLPELQQARRQGFRAFITYDPTEGSKLVKKPATYRNDATMDPPPNSTTPIPSSGVQTSTTETVTTNDAIHSSSESEQPHEALSISTTNDSSLNGAATA